jgi:hypothetical protein
MFVRRMLLFALLLLAVTTLTAGLAPAPKVRENPSPHTLPTPTPRPGRSVVVERALDASRRKPQTITVRTGDVLTLTVRSDEPDAVELQGLGALRAIAPDSPVTFDVLPDTPGSYPVVMLSTGRTVGTVRVVTPPR